MLTKSHWHTVDSTIEPACMWGYHTQTLDHPLYFCPLFDEPASSVKAWAMRVPAESIALLCPPDADTSLLKTWKKLCLRAVQVVSGVPSPSPQIDWNGHVVRHDASSTFAYSVRCHTMRSISDSKFLPVKACEGEYAGNSAIQGDNILSQGHVLRLMLVSWRKTAL